MNVMMLNSNKSLFVAKKQQAVEQIHIRSMPGCQTRGFLQIDMKAFPCALGRAGRQICKIEGDGATPIGHMRALCAFYRSDRIKHPQTALPLWRLTPNDGWCDAAFNANYNRPIAWPSSVSAEHMWRDDHLYDLGVILDWNYTQRAQGRGSAIFMHVARPNYTPTEGCIALKFSHLRFILGFMNEKTIITVV